MHIALFGTSADPPHRGHCEILRWLATQFDHVAVWASDNPFKAHQSPLGDRFAMLRLMIGDIPAPAGAIALYPELSSTRALESVEQARQIWPDAALTLVVGADLIGQLPRWYRAEALLHQVQILVIPRPGYDLAEDDLMEVQRRGGTVAIAAMPQQLNLSSSYYRQTDDTNVLPTAVKTYIDQKKLYLCLGNSRKTLPTP